MEEHFAALRIPDSDNDIKLTRAFSFSELPTTRRICLEQHYQSGVSPGMVRQYSCEQIFDRLSNIRQVKISEVVKAGDKEQKKTWETTIPSNDGFKVPEWPARKVSNIIPPPKLVQKEVEYMEIDDIQPVNRSLSCSPSLKSEGSNQDQKLFNSQSSKNIEAVDHKLQKCSSVNEEDKIDYQALKKKLRPLVSTHGAQKNNQESMSSCTKVLFFILLPIAFLTVGVVISPEYFGLFTPCDGTTTFCNAREDLRQLVFGQNKAVLALSSLLINDKNEIKILCLVGGTGVGKSYTTEIIKKNFPFQHNIFLYLPPLSEELDIGILSSATCNLLIIENMKTNDIGNVAKFLSPIKDLKEYCITAIAIINIEYTNKNLERQTNLPESMTEIQQFFEKYELQPAIVEFGPLNEKALEQCILEAAQASQLMLSRDQISRVQNILISANTGCKGAYSKLQIIGRE